MTTYKVSKGWLFQGGVLHRLRPQFSWTVNPLLYPSSMTFPGAMTWPYSDAVVIDESLPGLDVFPSETLYPEE